MLGWLACSVVASVSLSGCWLQVGFDAGHTRHNTLETALTADNAASLRQVWATDLLAATAEPMVRGGRVYVVTGGPDTTSTRTDVRALATADGGPVWTRTFGGAGEALFWQPSFVGDELWTGYFMVGSAGGRPIGSYAGPVRIDPADGSVISSTTDAVGLTAAVDVDDGDGDLVVQAWVSTSTPQRRLVVRDQATLATVWTADLAGDLATGLPGPAPAVVDGQIFVGDGTKLQAFPLAGCGAASCPPTWTLDLGSRPTQVAAAPGGDAVFVARATDVVAVDRATGAISWTAPQAASAAGFALAGGSVYVAVGGALATYPEAGCGAATCAPTASGTLDGNATTAPVVAGDVVYVGMANEVQAINATLGPLTPLASLPVTGTPSSLAVAGGRLFVVTARGGTLPSRITAFAPAPEPPDTPETP
jgi:outer membrane protein assembly factor BamB